MWLLFHRNAKTRAVRDGETFVERCPECGKRATFTEVEISENFGMFFVDIVGDKERAFRCGACGEVFDLKDRGEAAPPPPPVKSAAELERERKLAEKQRAAEAAAKATRIARSGSAGPRSNAEGRCAVSIEDELAELKKRMGK